MLTYTVRYLNWSSGGKVSLWQKEQAENYVKQNISYVCNGLWIIPNLIVQKMTYFFHDIE